LTAVAVSIGPLSAAYTFDLTGSYAGFIWAASALSLVAAWLLLGLGPVPDEFGPEQTAQ